MKKLLFLLCGVLFIAHHSFAQRTFLQYAVIKQTASIGGDPVAYPNATCLLTIGPDTGNATQGLGLPITNGVISSTRRGVAYYNKKDSAIWVNGVTAKKKLADTTVQLEMTRTVTGTVDTLSWSDLGKLIICTNGSAITLRIPATLQAGFHCTVHQGGAGKVVFTALGTTLHLFSTYTQTKGLYSTAYIKYKATNTYSVSGDLE